MGIQEAMDISTEQDSDLHNFTLQRNSVDLNVSLLKRFRCGSSCRIRSTMRGIEYLCSVWQYCTLTKKVKRTSKSKRAYKVASWNV